MATGDTLYNHLFSSVISDIKSYAGNDPLLPWLRGIRKMKESLPPHVLMAKLPRFLQKCAQTFETDRRYSNDLRYLRVWLQLLDYVDDPKAVLRNMENNRIGVKNALFYQAYALCYEKRKNYEAAEKVYHLGVQNLAEPLDDLQKSYDQFMIRLQKHKNKRIKCHERKSWNRLPSTISVPLNDKGSKDKSENFHTTENNPKVVVTKGPVQLQGKENNNYKNLRVNPMYVEVLAGRSADNGAMDGFSRNVYVKESEEPNKNRKITGDDTVVVKFVGNAMVGKSDVEDARHHGLVEPTINTKEAMNAINSMFCEPLEAPCTGNRSSRSLPKVGLVPNNEFEVYVDEKTIDGSKADRFGTRQPPQESFQIYDDDDDGDEGDRCFVFPVPCDVVSEPLKDHNTESPLQERPRREDTVVFRFVGSTISDYLEVENACHHGLVDPTINLKEAMADINNMFGKPIEFTRKSQPKKQNLPNNKNEGGNGGFMILCDDDEIDHCQEENKSKLSSPLRDNDHPKDPFLAAKMEGDDGGFLILPDDDDEINHCQEKKCQRSLSVKHENELYEKTICTKEAMDEINKMFSMPLDF
ncbi:hypothetical protein DM860_013616 [Cuscuta australis]|uniref:BUB1 N-terminal domain-containing protein n=1 Tax=Cuscuta australis TaxID=267555 RepID=A0A328EB61_9ASTE|nr:hypothetical protein DM860_013616 [Cuscuta australis]